jgi:putative endonuclease
MLGEGIASLFLELKGYEILDRNVSVAGREVDLVARDGDRLVAIEVKLRRGRGYGKAVQAVDDRKLGRIRYALTGMAKGSDLKPRIDVIAIDINDTDERMELEHYVGV